MKSSDAAPAENYVLFHSWPYRLIGPTALFLAIVLPFLIHFMDHEELGMRTVTTLIGFLVFGAIVANKYERRVYVSAEGLRFRRPLGTRTILWSEIARVTLAGDNYLLRSRSGKTFRIGTAMKPGAKFVLDLDARFNSEGFPRAEAMTGALPSALKGGTMTSLTIVPSRLARIGWPIFGIATGVFSGFAGGPWQPSVSPVMQWSSLTIGLMLVLGGLEFPWRKVVLDAAGLRERRWFHWREIHLPATVFVGRDPFSSRVAISEVSTGRALFSLGAEFGRVQQIHDELVAFFRQAGRLAGSSSL